MKTAEFVTKSVYGKDLIYPANLLAVELTELTGKKTATKFDLDKLVNIGIALNFIVLLNGEWV